MLECVVNLSEGRRLEVVDLIARTAGERLLDLHADPDHNRSVLTLVGEDAARSVVLAAVLSLDLRSHAGAHPRFGVADVVPFVPLDRTPMAEAVAARDRFARWLGDELDVPAFLYGEERTLPEVRRHAFDPLAPDFGPGAPHPTAGAVAVGARPVLIAYNLWLGQPDLDLARALARGVRSAQVRSLGLQVGDEVQVSMNLLAPLEVGPAQVYDAIARHTPVARAELVGLAPAAVVEATPRHRWHELDLAEERTIEWRLAARGLSTR
jgi:glutamate formiminotransferase / 5-formyltetrahydrofolate cyclo-ligase